MISQKTELKTKMEILDQKTFNNLAKEFANKSEHPNSIKKLPDSVLKKISYWIFNNA